MIYLDREQFKLKTYNFWDLFLHEHQYPYLGRCYAWAKRDGADLVSDIDPMEMWELFQTIVPKWDFAVYKLFNRSRPNVAILGNETPHLYAHLIPRYRTPCNYDGTIFVDPDPNGDYAPYPRIDLPLDTLLNIRDIMKGQIESDD